MSDMLSDEEISENILKTISCQAYRVAIGDHKSMIVQALTAVRNAALASKNTSSISQKDIEDWLPSEEEIWGLVLNSGKAEFCGRRDVALILSFIRTHIMNKAKSSYEPKHTAYEADMDKDEIKGKLKP